MPAQWLTGLSKRWERLLYWVREFVGENDYARYVAEWQAKHAGLECADGHRPMTEREFFAYRTELKFGGVVQRC